MPEDQQGWMFESLPLSQKVLKLSRLHSEVVCSEYGVLHCFRVLYRFVCRVACIVFVCFIGSYVAFDKVACVFVFLIEGRFSVYITSA